MITALPPSRYSTPQRIQRNHQAKAQATPSFGGDAAEIAGLTLACLLGAFCVAALGTQPKDDIQSKLAAQVDSAKSYVQERQTPSEFLKTNQSMRLIDSILGRREPNSIDHGNYSDVYIQEVADSMKGQPADGGRALRPNTKFHTDELRGLASAKQALLAKSDSTITVLSKKHNKFEWNGPQDSIELYGYKIDSANRAKDTKLAEINGAFARLFPKKK